MKKIYMVRHGQTYLNKYRRLQGWSDAPLTESGIAEAHRIGQTFKKIPFDLVASSDLKRASDTRKIIVSENDNWQTVKMVETPDLREYFFGFFEAVYDTDGVHQAFGNDKYDRVVDAVADGVSWKEVGDLFHAADPQGDAEPGQVYVDRLRRGIDWLANLDDSKNILLVCHACSIHCLATLLAKDGQKIPGRLPSHTEMTVLNVDDAGQVSLEEFGREV